ncbi:MAG: hypothetical protein COB67_07500 [SAR324 cluster bacterium]|uniref:Uncharacterized protein n=1 Tax=SAR324 cluster bacterium TaxID=2024889 RepID=A0A2A4T3P7_9DELT|nr:MAG: hypothetical protein COB67_07500 [SAR324 cluster bacterium]
MKVSDTTSQRQYHFETFERLVKTESKVRIIEIEVKKASPNELQDIELPVSIERAAERRREALSDFFGASIDWRELRFVHFAKDGLIYINVIEKATGRVLRTITEQTLEKMSGDFKHITGNTINISS